MHVHPLFSINYSNKTIMNLSSLILENIITIKRIRVIMTRQKKLILSAAYIFSILQKKKNKNNETCYFDNFNISSFKIGK